MSKYRFTALDINNKKIRGSFIAENEEVFRQIMNHQEYYLLSYHKVQESSQMFGFLEKIKTADFTFFLRQFAIMLNAGLNVNETIYFLIKVTKNKKLKSVLEVVYNDILQGNSLSEAFGKFPKTFPTFFRNMVSIGEEAGNLSVIFNRLANYYDNDARIKKKVKSALAYPIFLIILATLAVVFLALVVVPKFQMVFEQYQGELPLTTRIVTAFSNFMLDYYGFIILGIFVLVLLFTVLGRLKSVKVFKHKFKLVNPLTKKLNQAIYTSRFANGFSVLLNSGIKLIDSIDTISKLLDNTEIEKRLQIVKREIECGNTISVSLNAINVFPDLLIRMIEVGEETTSLEEVLDVTTVYFDEEVESQIKALVATIQPILLFIIAFMILMIILAIFQPMLGLMTLIEQSGTTAY